MLMCELVDKQDPVLQEPAKEIVVLVKEKVHLHNHGSETRVDATDTGGDSETCVDATDVGANFTGSDTAKAACARPWRSSLCVGQLEERPLGGRKSDTKDNDVMAYVAPDVHENNSAKSVAGGRQVASRGD